MPLGDLAGEVLGVVGRFLARIVVEFVFELLIKGTGYFIAARILRMHLPDPDGVVVVVLGLGFWSVVLFAGWSLIA